MAVSAPEVMYGAYYPYLYGRGAARSFHHAPHFQYDRLQGGGGGGGGEAFGGGAALSCGSSSGAHSPASPLLRARAKDEDASGQSRASASSESEGECAPGAAGGGAGGERRAQYVSANCVVFTHYSGDVAAVVDEHFARALAPDKHKESVPMGSRNLPASFFNAAACGGGGVELYEYDPWHQHYGGYGAARHAAEYHAAAAHHSMASYGGLLLGRAPLPQYKPVEWPHHAHHSHHAQHLDPAACAPYSYPAVPGLEAPVQDSSKDLYWF